MEQVIQSQTGRVIEEKEQIIMPLINSAFVPGNCLAFIKSFQDEDIKNIASAEYFYFSGQSEKALERAKPYLNCKNIPVRLSACLITAFANLTTGQIMQARTMLDEIKRFLSLTKCQSPQIKAMSAMIAYASSVLLHLPLPENMPTVMEIAHNLPTGLMLFLFYINAHYYYLQGKYEQSIGIVETALAMSPQLYPISAIYLYLAAVMDYMALKRPDNAKSCILKAWNIAKKDDLIEGFGEHHGLMGGMLEAVIKKDYPEDFKRIIDITYRFSAGWRMIHNPATGQKIAGSLTTTQFSIAMLAARGWSNKEIAELMHVSPETIKTLLSQAMKKLNISSRKDLKQYMLK